MNPHSRDPGLKALLIDAPVGRHFAQLHQDPASLAQAVGLYIETGIRRGTPVLVVAAADHTRMFMENLTRSLGSDIKGAQDDGLLALVDANFVLDQFMDHGMPDWSRFRQVLGNLFENRGLAGRPDSVRPCLRSPPRRSRST